MTTVTNCQNCSAPLDGDFCSQCGQHRRGIDRFFLALINEAFEDVFSLNSRAWKTFFALLFRPGFLSNEYFRGRRASYVQPIRLYFICSISFFVILSAVSFFAPADISVVDNSETVELEVSPAAPTKSPEPKTSEQVADSDSAADPRGSDAVVTSADKGFDAANINISVPFVSAAINQKLETKIRSQIAKAIQMAKNNPQDFSGILLDLAPPVIFCLLPLFAMLLKIAYVTRKFYYTEHLVFAVHTHCFVFLTLGLFSIIDLLVRDSSSVGSWTGLLIMLWIPVYLWLSLRNVYGQGRFFTTFKFLLLGVSYSILLLGGILTAVLVGIMTL